MYNSISYFQKKNLWFKCKWNQPISGACSKNWLVYRSLQAWGSFNPSTTALAGLMEYISFNNLLPTRSCWRGRGRSFIVVVSRETSTVDSSSQMYLRILIKPARLYEDYVFLSRLLGSHNICSQLFLGGQMNNLLSPPPSAPSLSLLSTFQFFLLKRLQWDRLRHWEKSCLISGVIWIEQQWSRWGGGAGGGAHDVWLLSPCSSYHAISLFCPLTSLDVLRPPEINCISV